MSGRRFTTWDSDLKSTRYWRQCWAGRHSPLRALLEKGGHEVPPLPPAELDLSVPVEAERLVREAKAKAADERRQRRPSAAVPRSVKRVREERTDGQA